MTAIYDEDGNYYGEALVDLPDEVYREWLASRSSRQIMAQRIARIQDVLTRILRNKPAKFTHDFCQAVRHLDRLPKRFREVIQLAEKFADRMPVCYYVETECGFLLFATHEEAEEYRRDNPDILREQRIPDSKLAKRDGPTRRKQAKKPKSDGKRLPGSPAS